jgi:hypothetical protein
MRRSSSSGSMKKSSSNGCLKALPFDNIISPIIKETQIEAITHTTAYQSGLCALTYVQDNDETNYKVCMSLPNETQEIPEPIFENKFNEERFEQLLVRVRNQRKKK